MKSLCEASPALLLQPTDFRTVFSLVLSAQLPLVRPTDFRKVSSLVLSSRSPLLQASMPPEQSPLQVVASLPPRFSIALQPQLPSEVTRHELPPPVRVSRLPLILA